MEKIRTWGKEIWNKKQEEQGSLGVIAGTVETKNFFDNQTKKEFELIERHILPLLNKKAKILDVGVGPFARFSIEFAKRGYSITGIDVSSNVLEAARKIVKKTGFNVNLIEDDLTDIKKIKEKQDLVFCFGTFGHIPSFLALKALKEFNKVLKKNGYVYIHFWINKEKKIKDIMHDFIYELGYHIKTKIGRVYKVNSSFYTEEEIEEMAKLSDFKIVLKIGDKYLFKKI